MHHKHNTPIHRISHITFLYFGNFLAWLNDWRGSDTENLSNFFLLYVYVASDSQLILFCFVKNFMFLESILMKPINQDWHRQRASASHFIWPYWFFSFCYQLVTFSGNIMSHHVNYTEISIFEVHHTNACTIDNQNHESPNMWLSNSTVLTLSSEKGWNALEIRSSAR